MYNLKSKGTRKVAEKYYVGCREDWDEIKTFFNRDISIRLNKELTGDLRKEAQQAGIPTRSKGKALFFYGMNQEEHDMLVQMLNDEGLVMWRTLQGIKSIKPELIVDVEYIESLQHVDADVLQNSIKFIR